MHDRFPARREANREQKKSGADERQTPPSAIVALQAIVAFRAVDVRRDERTRVLTTVRY